jgi:hypothetical protein
MHRWIPLGLILLGLLLTVVIPLPQPILMKGGSEEAFAEHRLMMIRLGIGSLMILIGLFWLLVRLIRRW